MTTSQNFRWYLEKKIISIHFFGFMPLNHKIMQLFTVLNLFQYIILIKKPMFIERVILMNHAISASIVDLLIADISNKVMEFSSCWSQHVAHSRHFQILFFWISSIYFLNQISISFRAYLLLQNFELVLKIFTVWSITIIRVFLRYTMY